MGKGIGLALAVGSTLVGMQHIQLHPTAFIDPNDKKSRTKILAPESLRGVGGVLISSITGQRFVNEL